MAIDVLLDDRGPRRPDGPASLVFSFFHSVSYTIAKGELSSAYGTEYLVADWPSYIIGHDASRTRVSMFQEDSIEATMHIVAFPVPCIRQRA